MDKMGVLFIRSCHEVDHPPDVIVGNERDGEPHRTGEPFGRMGHLFDHSFSGELEMLRSNGCLQLLLADFMVSPDQHCDTPFIRFKDKGFDQIRG